MAFIIRALITICIISLPSIVSASRVPGPAKITTSAWLYGWPMAGHDPERTNRSPVVGPTHPHLLWKRRGTTADAVDQNGSIYATMDERGNHSRTVRLDAAGQQRTAYLSALGPVGLAPNGTLFTAGFNLPKGHQGLAVSEDSAVAAFSPAGKPLWRIQPTGLLKGSLPLVTESGDLYAPFEGPGDELAGLDVISPDGRQRYTQRGPAFFTTALAPSGTIYALTHSHASDTSYVEALSPAGTVLWQHPLRVSVEMFCCDRLLVGDNGTLYVIDGGNLLAYDPSGRLLWRFQKHDEARALAERADGVLLIAGQRVLDAVSLRGTQLWHRKIGTGKSLVPSLIVDAAGKAYVGTGDGRLSVFSASGDLLSRVTVGPRNPISSPVSLLGPGGRLIVNGTDGELRVYAP